MRRTRAQVPLLPLVVTIKLIKEEKTNGGTEAECKIIFMKKKEEEAFLAQKLNKRGGRNERHDTLYKKIFTTCFVGHQCMQLLIFTSRGWQAVLLIDIIGWKVKTVLIHYKVEKPCSWHHHQHSCTGN